MLFPVLKSDLKSSDLKSEICNYMYNKIFFTITNFALVVFSAKVKIYSRKYKILENKIGKTYVNT